MLKTNKENLDVLFRQVQSINKVLVDTMNKIEIIRDNELDAGPGTAQRKFDDDQSHMSEAIALLTSASDFLDSAELWLKKL